MTIFQFFKTAAAAILKFQNFNVGVVKMSNCIQLRKLVAIGQTVAEIWRFFDFPIWQLSAILDLWCTCLDHPQRAFGGLYHCAKFGQNRHSSFDNMQVFYTLRFRHENAYSCPQNWGTFGGYNPHNWQQSHHDHQKALPCGETRHMTYRSSKSVDQCGLCTSRRIQ